MNTNTTIAPATPSTADIGLMSAATKACARTYDGLLPTPAERPVTGGDTTWTAPAAAARVGTRLLRCNTGESYLGGAASSRQLERDLLR